MIFQTSRGRIWISFRSGIGYPTYPCGPTLCASGNFGSVALATGASKPTCFKWSWQVGNDQKRPPFDDPQKPAGGYVWNHPHWNILESSMCYYTRKLTFWIQSYGGLVQMMFLFKEGDFLGSNCSFSGGSKIVFLWRFWTMTWIESDESEYEFINSSLKHFENPGSVAVLLRHSTFILVGGGFFLSFSPCWKLCLGFERGDILWLNYKFDKVVLIHSYHIQLLILSQFDTCFSWKKSHIIE